jgi:outer membrane lipoprotein SlyB
MIRSIGAAALLTLSVAMATPAAAQNGALGGAIIGGGLGAIIGGAATNTGTGVAIGAVIGATAGAVIGAEAEQRQTGYYWWHGGCYYRYPDNSYLRVRNNRCM